MEWANSTLGAYIATHNHALELRLGFGWRLNPSGLCLTGKISYMKVNFRISIGTIMKLCGGGKI